MGGREAVDAAEYFAEVVRILEAGARGHFLDGKTDIAEKRAGDFNPPAQNIFVGRQSRPAAKHAREMTGTQSRGAREIDRSDAMGQIRLKIIERFGDADAQNGIEIIVRSRGVSLKQAGEDVQQKCIGLEAREWIDLAKERNQIGEPRTDGIARLE